MTPRTELTLRAACGDDIPRISVLEYELFSAPWSEGDLAGELSRSYASLIVAELEGEVAGYADIHIVSGDAHINLLAVDPNFRRRGIGLALIEECVRLAHGCDLLTLEVRSQNLPALALYEKAGFERCGVRRSLYRQPDDDGITMIYKGNLLC